LLSEVIPVEARDADVRLSPLGEDQARAVGRWLAAQRYGSALRYGFASPYTRALRTGQLAVSELPAVSLVADERLCDISSG
jgi:broad specificity phosphatase PhoE